MYLRWFIDNSQHEQLHCTLSLDRNRMWSYDPSFKSRECGHDAFRHFNWEIWLFLLFTFPVVMLLELWPFSKKNKICWFLNMSWTVVATIDSDVSRHFSLCLRQATAGNVIRKKLFNHPCVRRQRSKFPNGLSRCLAVLVHFSGWTAWLCCLWLCYFWMDFVSGCIQIWLCSFAVFWLQSECS